MKAKTITDFQLHRARVIVRQMTEWKLVEMGLRDGPAPDLSSYSLHDMLEANHMVRDHGKVTNADGTQSIQVVCDDRLIAALYTLCNYPADDPRSCEAIVSDGRRALVCVNVEPL